jgi:DNA-directed RNA polymerase I, II, and III subunit RPABC2
VISLGRQTNKIENDLEKTYSINYITMSLQMNEKELLEEKEPELDVTSDSSEGEDDDVTEDELEDDDNDHEKEDDEKEKDDDESDDDESDVDITDINIDDTDINDDDDQDNDDDSVLNESDDENETTFRKLEECYVDTDLEKLHPEIRSVNFDEIKALSRVVRDGKGKIIDPLHTTVPFITKYEKARIIGTRAEQLERGSMPFVELEPHIMNARTIAQLEFEQKRIPFIIARPLPNKAVEYWRVQDLEVL